MKTSTFALALILSVLACKSAPQGGGASAPPNTATSGSAAADGADGGTPIAPAPAPAPADADASTPEPADASAPEPASPLVGLHALTFRAGAHPPVGAAGAHGATVWAVTLAASAGASPELTALFQQCLAAHLAASLGELRCAPAVGGAYPGTVPSGDGAQAVTVTFRTERDARAFAAALTEAPLHIGRVRVLCAD